MEKQAPLRCGGNGSIFFTLHHVDHLPRAILCTKLASDTDFLVNNDNAVDVCVEVVVRIFGTGYFIEAIDWTKFNADFASRTTFGMNNCDERRFLFLLWRRNRNRLLRCCNRFRHIAKI